MQEGDSAVPRDDCLAMIGAAVARHYMEGTVEFPTNAVKAMCKTIAQSGGVVLLNATVTEIMISQNHTGGVKLYDKMFYSNRVISAVGVINTLKIANVPQLSSCYKTLSASHFSVFIGLKGTRRQLDLPYGNIWIREKDQEDVFISFEEQTVKGNPRVAVHLISPESDPGKWFSLNRRDYERAKETRLCQLARVFYSRFPAAFRSEIVRTAGTPLTSNTFLNSPMGCSYGIRCGSRRFLEWKTVRALRPETSIVGLYLTGQDILMMGICSAMASGLMTARQVLGYSICDAIQGKDILDEIKSFNAEHLRATLDRIKDASA